MTDDSQDKTREWFAKSLVRDFMKDNPDMEITREKLLQAQMTATMVFIAAMQTQIDYRRSVPLSSDRVVAIWDALKATLDNSLDAAMAEYYESNNIIPYTESEEEQS